MGILEHLDASECRFRSLAEFAVGETVSFDYEIGGKIASVSGDVVSRVAGGPRKNYVLKLRAGSAPREHAKPPARAAVPSPLVRSSIRVPVDFTLGFAHDSGLIGHGRATNVSEGGMHVIASAVLPVGATLELSFVLPGGNVELVSEARIVAKQPSEDGRFAYNLAFVNLAANVHERVAAFVRKQKP
jgi:hypothetical protein